METKKKEELLTVDETADALRLGRTRTNELLWSKTLPSVKIGRRRLVRRADLDAFVEAHEDRTGEE